MLFKILIAHIAVLCIALVLYVFWEPAFDETSLDGKRVLVTGASTGIGRQIALWYCKLGASVVVTARREKLLKEVVAECQLLGKKQAKYRYISADMIDYVAAEMVIEFAKKELGGIDVLVLNHIIAQKPRIWNNSHEDLNRMDTQMEVNFRSYAHLTTHAFGHLIARNGSIIVVSSFAGLVGMPYLEGYSASKFALNGFFSGLREEYKLRGINISITMCFLGFIGTDAALEGMQGFKRILEYVKPADTKETALAIVKGGTIRAESVYYPYGAVRLMSIAHKVLPDLVNHINRYMWEYQ